MHTLLNNTHGQLQARDAWFGGCYSLCEPAAVCLEVCAVEMHTHVLRDSTHSQWQAGHVCWFENCKLSQTMLLSVLSMDVASV